MKTFEKNQNTQDKNPTNQPVSTNQPTPTNQPNPTPGSQTQDPAKLPLDPTRRENPVKEPARQQPYVDPDPTSPEKDRTTPYAEGKTHEQRKENSGDIHRTKSDIDTNPTGETKNNPEDVNDPSRKGNNPSTTRNAVESETDRDNQEI